MQPGRSGASAGTFSSEPVLGRSCPSSLESRVRCSAVGMSQPENPGWARGEERAGAGGAVRGNGGSSEPPAGWSGPPPPRGTCAHAPPARTGGCRVLAGGKLLTRRCLKEGLRFLPSSLVPAFLRGSELWPPARFWRPRLRQSGGPQSWGLDAPRLRLHPLSDTSALSSPRSALDGGRVCVPAVPTAPPYAHLAGGQEPRRAGPGARAAGGPPAPAGAACPVALHVLTLQVPGAALSPRTVVLAGSGGLPPGVTGAACPSCVRLVTLP